MELDLDVFFHTDETKKRESRGETVLMTDYRIDTITFYHIDYIAPYYENGVEYAKVGSGGDSFISIMGCAELKKEIRNAKSIN